MFRFPHALSAPPPPRAALLSIELEAAICSGQALATPDLFFLTRLKSPAGDGASQRVPSHFGSPESLSCSQAGSRNLCPAVEPQHTMIEFTRFRGLPRARDLPDELVQAWMRKLPLEPAELCASLLEGLPVSLGGGELTAQRTGGDLESVDLTLQLLCEEHGRPVGLLEQELSFLDDGLHQAYFRPIELCDGGGRRGIDRVLLANSVRLFQRLGIVSVNLLASGESGGYTWAKCGFKPETEEDAWELYTTLIDSLDALDISQRTRMVVKNLLDGHQPEAVWAISDLERARVTVGGQRISLGRALLRHTDWQGSLDLEDPVAMARFAKYIRRA